jgi:hypothetical protein
MLGFRKRLPYWVKCSQKNTKWKRRARANASCFERVGQARAIEILDGVCIITVKQTNRENFPEWNSFH